MTTLTHTALVVVEFEDGRISAERIYWDQASVLIQVGLLDAAGLEPSNRLIG